MPPIGEESDEQTRAYRKNQMNAEEAGPWSRRPLRPEEKLSADLDVHSPLRERRGSGEGKSAEVMLMER